jgi:hypothetical protein
MGDPVQVPALPAVAKQAVNTDEERRDPAVIASWGHEIAQTAVVRFRTWMVAGRRGELTAADLEDMRSLATQLRLMAQAAAAARDAQAQTRLF